MQLSKQQFYSNISIDSLTYYISSNLRQDSGNFILVCDEQYHHNLRLQLLNNVGSKIVYSFPKWDCKIYDHLSPHSNILAKRMHILYDLATSENFILLIDIKTLGQLLPPKDMVELWSLELHKGTKFNRNSLTNHLTTMGYKRSETATDIGEYAVRGGLIDIVTNKHFGYRIDFFGDEIDEIKQYDLVTQLTTESSNKVIITPNSEIILEDEYIKNFKNKYHTYFNYQKNDYHYQQILHKQTFPSYEFLLPLFYEKLDNIFDYIKNPKIIHYNQPLIDYENYYQEALKTYNLRVKSENILPFNNLYIEPTILSHLFDKYESYSCGMFEPISYNDVVCRANINPLIINEFKNKYSYLKELLKHQIRPVICCDSEGSLERLKIILHSHDYFIEKLDNLADISKIKGKNIGIIIYPLENGFIVDKVALIAEADLLGKKLKRRTAKKINVDNLLAEFSSLSTGELIVHRDHGIGKFMGLEIITIAGRAHDCVKLIYADEDKLFLPVENIDLLSRYGDSTLVALDKLGAASWQNRAAKIKNRIKLQAEVIIKIAAQRELNYSESLMVPSDLYKLFCDKFPFVETEDQLTAIDDILQDLSSEKPMDRLICGDVGFGKTEVAMRAAFAAIFGKCDIAEFTNDMPRKQAAIIAPTTLLARQHYQNCLERFNGFPVRIKQLSRMVSAKEAKLAKEQLALGEIDLIVGTHALLSDSVKFKDLSLVVIDEEQHFGVAQKEKLKDLKNNVNVLTLSATPIPRTLHMAISGIRELSLITTPPVDRVAIRSYVLKFDPIIVKEAINNEQARGGRVFFVAPRISDLKEIENFLSEYLPKTKYRIAHGQMNASSLDKIMNEFYDGSFDILVATTIVESGLDIPSANTMIIYRADMLGLSQLYQIRGRVGRGKIKAYCYFTTPNIRILSNNARKRLEIMQKLDNIGAGFSLASHDMDIRGVGNLMGDEQSGHIKEVGVELYQQMLKEAVEELRCVKENKIENDSENNISSNFVPQLNLGLSILIPEEYVSDLNLRLGLYQRIAKLNNMEELDALYTEMIDRFGPIPENTKHLFHIIELKQLCKKANIHKIDSGPSGLVITFWQNHPLNIDKLMKYIAIDPENSKIRPDEKLVIIRKFKDDLHKIEVVKKLINKII